MTDYPFFQIDAFASNPFEGNQACVMPLDAFLAKDRMQAIAAENNVSETTFIVPDGDGCWKIRWFTPAVEVPLCGHATLAAAHVIYNHLGADADRITLRTEVSGDLFVSRAGEGRLEMDFPASPIEEIEIDDAVAEALGARPIKAWAGTLYAAQFESPETVNALQPDYRALAAVGVGEEPAVSGGFPLLGNFGCFALGGENGADVTSRFFGPGSGIDEDPATGSWHCMLLPVVSALTGTTQANCYQSYPGRGAWVGTKLVDDRVKLIGQSVTVIEGTFRL